jgi:hypothetical protein
VTVRFIIAMLVLALNDRMARRVDYPEEEVRLLKEALVHAGAATPACAQGKGVDARGTHGVLSDRAPRHHSPVVSAARGQEVRQV